MTRHAVLLTRAHRRALLDAPRLSAVDPGARAASRLAERAGALNIGERLLRCPA
jgi:hypothetical protein